MRFSQRLALAGYRAWFRVLGALSPKLAARKAFRLFCTPQSRHRAALPPVFAGAEALDFSFDGHTVHGFRWNAGAPRKALLLHGFRSSITNFDGFVQPLIDKGYEVLAFDAPAHGRSPGKSITVVTYMDMITGLWNRFGPFDSFIAHSFGGLALSLALEQLPCKENTKVVLIAPAAETVRAMNVFFHFLHITPALQKAFADVIRETGGHDPAWFSVNRALAGTRAQVLFLQDSEDRVTPVDDLGPLMRDPGPNIRFVITRGLGHRRIYREASSVRTVMDFL